MLSSEPILSSQTIDASEPRSQHATARPKLLCRQIRDGDLDAVVACLARGFPERSTAYWRRGLMRLRERAVPEGRPRYGYALAANGTIVGVVLLIFATTDEGRTRANVSSWYVDAAYRSFSSVLLGAAFRAGGVTFLNISAAPSTLQTIAAQGYLPYAAGTFHTLAALARRLPGAEVRTVVADTPGATPLLAEHAACGCICLEVVHRGAAYPFVFVPARSVRNRLPSAQLVYCRSLAEMVRFAGPVGRHLARLGLASVMIDASGPIPGLRGRYAAGRRMRFYRGPDTPRLGDLSYTELVYLGP